MHAHIEICRYHLSERYKKMPLAMRQKLAQDCLLLDVPLDEEVPKTYSIPYSWQNEHFIDLTTVGAVLVEHDIDFKIKRFKGSYRVEGTQDLNVAGATVGAVHNVTLQVAIPNLLLWAVDEVMVYEDACTESLQKYLDEGWRMLAICPPAAQRRPDYILGRQKAMVARD